MKWIRWTQWTSTGCTLNGHMPLNQIDASIKRFERKAAQLLKASGADHVLYAVKYYDSTEKLESISFYMMAMSEQEYEEKVVPLTGVLVYALHARR